MDRFRGHFLNGAQSRAQWTSNTIPYYLRLRFPFAFGLNFAGLNYLQVVAGVLIHSVISQFSNGTTTGGSRVARNGQPTNVHFIAWMGHSIPGIHGHVQVCLFNFKHVVR